MKIFKILFPLLLTCAIFLFGIKPALAFCGFYVAKADSSLYNQASQVIIARDGRRTVLTMSNDYQGEVKDFAMVVPVPVVLTEEQVHIADPEIIDRLDAFSAPRLVEYYNPNCFPPPNSRASDSIGSLNVPSKQKITSGVTIEQQFTVGEYNILILSAEESNGLPKWLTDNGYRLPQNSQALLQPYIRQGMKFFVAKVNLEEFNNSDFKKLRPISIAYESSKFMLPIRLGMSNAKNEQDLIVYLLSPQGQVELTNYRTVKITSDVEIPEFVQTKFSDFYQAMFATAYERENKEAAFIEYAWDLSTKCDPCVGGVFNPQEQELKEAGVFWLDGSNNNSRNVFMTRLHVRYSRDKFPEDLKFQSTNNQKSFQGRYIIHHPFVDELDLKACPPIEDFSNWRLITHRSKMTYLLEREMQNPEKLALRRKEEAQSKRSEVFKREKEAQNLASLTGWNINEIRQKMAKYNPE